MTTIEIDVPGDNTMEVDELKAEHLIQNFLDSLRDKLDEYIDEHGGRTNATHQLAKNIDYFNEKEKRDLVASNNKEHGRAEGASYARNLLIKHKTDFVYGD